MIRIALVICAVAHGVAAAAPVTSRPSRPAVREAAAIIADLDAVRLPPYDASKRDDATYGQQYAAASREAGLRQAALAKELYDAHPSHPKAGQMMVRRWDLLIQFELDWATTARESKRFLDAHAASGSRPDALHHRAAALARTGTYEEALAAAEAFVALRPDDHERGGYLFEVISEQHSVTGGRRWRDLHQQIADRYRGTRTGQLAAGRIRRADGLGKPFELAFIDAVTGKRVTVAGLRGNVVVVDFWATWCKPCVAELPAMQRLYADLKDQGVEIVGVSLDAPAKDGGLDKLKAFVGTQGIEWPQYYQGNGWESEFSSSWGIASIPAVFLVDAHGNLRSTDARDDLRGRVANLLKERGSKPPRQGK